MTTKANHRLTLKDRLSRLNFTQACFLGELVSQQEPIRPPAPDTVAGLKQRLAECVEEDHQGRQRLSITLPNRDMLDNLATTLARLLVAKPE